MSSTPEPTAPIGLRVISLFSGIGALDKGLEDSGHTVIEMCESWEPARRVLAHQFPRRTIDSDVRGYLPLVDYDVLAAGFPCTDISHAGSRAGIFGNKSGLVADVFRIAREQMPKWIVLENVTNLLSLHSGNGMRHITAELEFLGYRWAYRTVDSRFTGVPQRRFRVIILASLVADPASVLFEGNEQFSIPDGRISSYGFYWTEGRNGLGLVEAAIPTLKGGSTLGLPSSPAIWFPDSPNGRRFVLPSVEDGEALQGLPRGWTECAVVEGETNHRWKLVGNAVTVGVGRWIGRILSLPSAETSSVGAREINKERPWPQAGWGGAGSAWISSASMWPERAIQVDLAGVIDSASAPVLSHRATTGFLSRLDESRRVVPAAFYRDLEHHQAATRPRLPRRIGFSSGDADPTSRKPRLTGVANLRSGLRHALSSHGVRYRLQVRPSDDSRLRLDMAFTSERVAVDIRSCFWHGCPDGSHGSTLDSERWGGKLSRIASRDEQFERELTELGWRVIVIWEHETVDEAAARIFAIVTGHSGANGRTQTGLSPLVSS